jgi:cob(I)alamin adenosyltransferase
LSKNSGKGLVQVFTGNGKGKTSAALGAAVRASGHGLKVFIVFFMKGKYEYGEYNSLAKLPNVTMESFGFRSLTDPNDVKEKEKEQARLALAASRDAIQSGKYDMVIMDEINVATGFNLIELDDVIKMIREKPPKIDLILTGRYADPKLLEIADLVTEMVKVKHPFDSGILARKGIEY